MSILFNDGNGNFLDGPVSANEDIVSEAGCVIDVYPNPCRDYVSFKTGETDTEELSINIFNIRGQLIDTLSASSGDQPIWNLKDRNGKRVESGIYLLRVYEQGNYIGSRKLMVIK